MPGLFRGLAVTGRHLARHLHRAKAMPPLQFPERRHGYGPRFRGRHRLMQRQDGEPRCVACMLCSTACPAGCIAIVAAERPDPAVHTHPESFTIDLLRCVFCGLCEEACPCDAIRLDTGIHEMAASCREVFVVDREFLLHNDKDGTL